MHNPLISIFLSLLAICTATYAQKVNHDYVHGNYYLQHKREVGSELLLRKDGSFEWMMSYGAVDQWASGKWKAENKVIILDAATPSGSPKLRLFDESELNIRKPAKPGTWVAIVGKPRVGPVAYPIEVVFESASGKTYSAVTDRNGDAIASVPDNEVWTRAGLRAKGTDAPLQWFVIPEDRVADRIACFAIADNVWINPQAFKQMRLKQRDAKLVSEDGALVYARE